MKRVTKYGTVLFLAAGIFLLPTCELPTGNGPEPLAENMGTLEFSFGGDLLAQTIRPPVDMDTAYYIVEGDGPGNVGFEVRIEAGIGGRAQRVAAGTWTVTANAYNRDEQLIGRGSSTVSVVAEQATVARIAVRQLEGKGMLAFTIRWPVERVGKPFVSASVTPESGQVITMLGTDMSADTAAFEQEVPVGYYALSVVLFDDTVELAGFSEAVWIVENATTSFEYTFTDINGGSGDFGGIIENEIEQPLTVTIAGVPSVPVEPDQEYTVSATVAESLEVEVKWFLNGRDAGTGNDYTIGNLSPGIYTLTAIAFAEDGSRAGSESMQFRVRDTNGGPGTLSVMLEWPAEVIRPGFVAMKLKNTANDQTFEISSESVSPGVSPFMETIELPEGTYEYTSTIYDSMYYPMKIHTSGTRTVEVVPNGAESIYETLDPPNILDAGQDSVLIGTGGSDTIRPGTLIMDRYPLLVGSYGTANGLFEITRYGTYREQLMNESTITDIVTHDDGEQVVAIFARKSGFDTYLSIQNFGIRSRSPMQEYSISIDGADVYPNVIVHDSGLFYIGGYTTGGWGDIRNAGGRDAVVFVMNDRFTLERTFQWGTPGDDEVTDITKDDSGNLYVSGTTTGVMDGTDRGGQHCFIAGIGSTGIEWVQQFGGSGADERPQIEGTASGVIAAMSLGDGSGRSLQFIRIDAGGNIVWERNRSASYRETVYDLTRSGSDYYAAGHTFRAASGSEPAPIVFRITENGGLTERQFGGEHRGTATAVDVDGDFVYAAGTGDDPAYLHEENVSFGSDDIFLVRFPVGSF